jgi:hypothetical protein
MGADQFTTKARGATVADAFRDAKETALYEYGHRGYTGTIAEKDSFEILTPTPVLTLADAEQLAEFLLRKDDPRISDKWGPAGAIEYRDPDAPDGVRSFVFVGWAAS